MNKTIHFLVSGRVQGVFFRMHTQQQADRHGLTGWVKNLPDGRVEGIASGDAGNLELFLDWLRHGPSRARVTGVEVTEREYQPFNGFVIQ